MSRAPLGRWVSVQQLAEAWQISERTLVRWIRDRRIKAKQFAPRIFRVPLDEVERFLEQCPDVEPMTEHRGLRRVK